MNANARWSVAVAAISAACLWGAVTSTAAITKEAAEAEVMMGDYQAQQRAAAAARAKDPTWKPSTAEVALIQIGNAKTPGALRNFCLDRDGNILACVGPAENAKGSAAKNAPEQGIRLYSPAGKLLSTTPLPIKPTAICVGKDGSIFVAGDGRLLKLNAAGKVLASAASPVAKDRVIISDEMQEMVKSSAQESKRPYKQELANFRSMLETRRTEVTGVAVTDEDVFMAVPATTDFTYRIYRFDHALKSPKLVVEKLRGCCGQMDVQAHAGKLWIPHNGRHSVEARDRDGKELSKFGKSGKVKPTEFGGCCEPKNLRVLSNGDILAAESGPPTCIKRFSASGKFKEVVAVADNSTGNCVRVTVEVSPDGSRYYLLDTTRDAIRVFKAKS